MPTTCSTKQVDQVVVDVVEHAAVAGARSGSLGIHVQPAQLLDGDRRDRVHDRAERAQRLEQALAVGVLVAGPDRLDDHERLAADGLRDLRDRRELEDAADRGHLVRQVVRPGAPRLQDLGRPVDREPEDAGVDLRDREEVELDRRDDPEGAAAAAERPEQVRLVRPVGADEVARGRDDLDRGDLVGADAVLAREPGEAAAERVADDADVRRGAGERGQAVLGRRLDDLDPDHACLGARDPVLGVDRDAAHALGLEQDRVVRALPSRRRRGRCPAARCGARSPWRRRRSRPRPRPTRAARPRPAAGRR